MSKRAMIRRERKKIDKANKSRAADGDLQRMKTKGMIDGRVIAASVVLEIMHDKHNFSNKKVQRLLNAISNESLKFYEAATLFNVEWYADRMVERIKAVTFSPVVRSAKEQIYVMARDDFYISACSVMFLALNEEFGFSSNAKGTGRTDYIMEYCINRYIEMNLDPDRHTAQYYFDRMKEKTGYDIE